MLNLSIKPQRTQLPAGRFPWAFVEPIWPTLSAKRQDDGVCAADVSVLRTSGTSPEARDGGRAVGLQKHQRPAFASRSNCEHPTSIGPTPSGDTDDNSGGQRRLDRSGRGSRASPNLGAAEQVLPWDFSPRREHSGTVAVPRAVRFPLTKSIEALAWPHRRPCGPVHSLPAGTFASEVRFWRVVVPPPLAIMADFTKSPE